MITETKIVRNALLDFKIADHYVDKIIEEIELRTVQSPTPHKTEVKVKLYRSMMVLLKYGTLTVDDLLEVSTDALKDHVRNEAETKTRVAAQEEGYANGYAQGHREAKQATA